MLFFRTFRIFEVYFFFFIFFPKMLSIFFFPQEKFKIHSLTQIQEPEKKIQHWKKKITTFSLTHSIFDQKWQKLNFSREIKKYGTFGCIEVKMLANKAKQIFIKFALEQLVFYISHNNEPTTLPSATLATLCGLN